MELMPLWLAFACDTHIDVGGQMLGPQAISIYMHASLTNQVACAQMNAMNMIAPGQQQQILTVAGSSWNSSL